MINPPCSPLRSSSRSERHHPAFADQGKAETASIGVRGVSNPYAFAPSPIWTRTERLEAVLPAVILVVVLILGLLQKL
ncbi:hypothetical protein Phage2-1_00116 [Achromobacter phage 2-1]|nr:hypothetical protein Phage2-1_00116 [Achromobacter phage 2-1]